MKKLIIIMMFVMTIPLLAQIGKPTKENTLVFEMPYDMAASTTNGIPTFRNFTSKEFAVTTDSIAFVLEQTGDSLVVWDSIVFKATGARVRTTGNTGIQLDSTVFFSVLHWTSPSGMPTNLLSIDSLLFRDPVSRLSDVQPIWSRSTYYVPLGRSKAIIEGTFFNFKKQRLKGTIKVYKVEKRIY